MHHIGQPGEDLLIARRILRQHLEEVEQHLVIVEQPAHRLVAGRDGGLFDRAAFLQVAEQVVAPRVGPDVHRLAAAGVICEGQDALAGPAQAVIVGRGGVGQPADGHAVPIHHAQLAVDIEQQHDLLARGRWGHAAREVEPGAVEQPAPGVADRERLLLAGLAFGERDRLARAPRADVQLADDGVDGGLDLFQGHVEVAFGVGFVGGHVESPVGFGR